MKVLTPETTEYISLKYRYIGAFLLNILGGFIHNITRIKIGVPVDFSYP